MSLLGNFTIKFIKVLRYSEYKKLNTKMLVLNFKWS